MNVLEFIVPCLFGIVGVTFAVYFGVVGKSAKVLNSPVVVISTLISFYPQTWIPEETPSCPQK